MQQFLTLWCLVSGIPVTRVMLKMPNISHSWRSIMTVLKKPSFKFWSSAVSHEVNNGSVWTDKIMVVNCNSTTFGACPYQTKLYKFIKVNMLDICSINLENSSCMITKTQLHNFITINRYLIMAENSRNATRLLVQYYEINNWRK